MPRIFEPSSAAEVSLLPMLGTKPSCPERCISRSVFGLVDAPPAREWMQRVTLKGGISRS
jgi:hypothetical protein